MRIVCFVLLFFAHISAWGADFQIASVGQAGFNIIKNGTKCIVFDCGNQIKAYFKGLGTTGTAQSVIGFR